MVELVIKLEEMLFRGEVVYLHCFGGHGRAGTVAAILLGKIFKLDPNRVSLHRKYVLSN